MNSELRKGYTIAAAGLFHDIGKLLDRVGIKLEKQGEYNTKKCGYAHAARTAMFLQGKVGDRDYGSVFRQFEESGDSDNSSTSLINLAAMHHNPEDSYQWIIAESDRLSSAFERIEGEPDEYEEYLKALKEQEKELGEKASYKKLLLGNIFSEINFTQKGETKPFNSFYPLKTLSPCILPNYRLIEGKDDAKEGYRKLLEGLQSDLAKISADKLSIENIYAAICSVLEKHCWCIPAATVRKVKGQGFLKEPTFVSLYDHMRTTSAIATALYTYHTDKDSLSVESIKDRNAEKFCFIQGDFTGIQDFIFDAGGVSNKFAAKILRAKSFFVSMATEAAAYAVCDEMNIPYSSIVLNAGGKFTIITGNTDREKDAINKVSGVINQRFNKLTFGQTRFNIASITFSPNELTGDGTEFGKLMDRLSRELEKQKLRPVVVKHVFDGYLEVRGGKDVCKICGKHWGESEVYDVMVCEHCKAFQNIGQQLVKAEYVQLSKTSGYPLFGDWRFSFNLDVKPEEKDFTHLFFDISLDSEFRGFAKKRVSNYVPKDNEGIKDFEKIAEAAVKDGRGTANLAVLKADVDNLGQIFIKGLQNNSISKTATLSRMLDYFFTGWLQNELKGKDIYTVFAGGDDLFLIGAWNQIVELSGKIAEHLKAYSGGNTNVHLSAGVILRKPVVVVREMAEDAEEALAKAKKGDSEHDNRNRINIFGQTVKWEYYNELCLFKDKLETLDSEIKLSAGYLYGLMKFSEDVVIAENPEFEISVKWLNAAKWRALLRYRNYKNYEKSAEKLEFIVGEISTHKLALKIPLSHLLFERRRR